MWTRRQAYRERWREEREGGSHLHAGERTNPLTDTSLLDVWPPEPWENKLLSCKPATLRYLVTAAQQINAPTNHANVYTEKCNTLPLVSTISFLSGIWCEHLGMQILVSFSYSCIHIHTHNFHLFIFNGIICYFFILASNILWGSFQVHMGSSSHSP